MRPSAPTWRGWQRCSVELPSTPICKRSPFGDGPTSSTSKPPKPPTRNPRLRILTMGTDYLPIALRAYTEIAAPNRRLRRRRKASSWKRPRLVLVLDTETGTDRAQALTFGCARICRLAGDRLILLRE